MARQPQVTRVMYAVAWYNDGHCWGKCYPALYVQARIGDDWRQATTVTSLLSALLLEYYNYHYINAASARICQVNADLNWL